MQEWHFSQDLLPEEPLPWADGQNRPDVRNSGFPDPMPAGPCDWMWDRVGHEAC